MKEDNSGATSNNNQKDEIVITGFGCHFPGIEVDIETGDDLFQYLIGDESAIQVPPKTRWSTKELQSIKLSSPLQGGFLKDISLFDANFFNLSREQANELDPQTRLFLETSIKALNHANIPIHHLNRQSVGIYCGISTGEYGQLNFKDNVHFGPHTSIGVAQSSAPGRLSHFLNTKGPTLTVDTACSSSLAAIYLAEQAMNNNECQIAIVGGVHLSICLDIFEGLYKAKMLSPSYQCRSFDESRNGYARSEGCGVIILKKQTAAISDGDNIYGVIKACHMNQDGGETSFKAPNQQSQEDLHLSLYKKAHVKPKDIDYIETHGTGTVIGDKVEFNAIKNVHAGQHDSQSPLILGAIKSNLGHTISASGVLGLIKVLMSFKKKLIPHNLNFTKPSTDIPLEEIPAIIPVENTLLPIHKERKALAQISNYGYTGTNVSILVEQAKRTITQTPSSVVPKHYAILLSGKSKHSLEIQIDNLISYLETTENHIYDISYTSMAARTHFGYRMLVIGKNKEQIIQKLKANDYELKQTVAHQTNKKIINLEELDVNFFNGIQIDPSHLLPEGKKVDFPLYAFDRQSYWHKKNNTTTDNAISKTNQVLTKHPCYKARWIETSVIKSQKSLDILDASLLETYLHSPSATKPHVILFDGFKLEPDSDNQAPDINSLLELERIIRIVVDNNINIPLVVITNHSQTIDDGQSLNLNQSLIAGYVKAAHLELPDLQLQFIDFDTSSYANKDKIIADEYYNELKSLEPFIAYRKQKRLVYRILPQPIEDSTNLSIDADKSYLITGGLGGLGLISAQTLLKNGARHIICVSRKSTKKALDYLNELKNSYPDADIQCIESDVSDFHACQKLFKTIDANGYPLQGIIHAAGIALKKPLLECDKDEYKQVIAGKVKGAWHLHQLTTSRQLDFFLLYSSVSSIFGANLETAYAGANEYLNQLANYRKSLGLTATAIQWSAWGETGMAIARSQNLAISPHLISNKDGVELIEIALSKANSAQLCFVSKPFAQFMLDFMPRPIAKSFDYFVNDNLSIEESNNQHTSEKLTPNFVETLLNLTDSEKYTLVTEKVNQCVKDLLNKPHGELINPELGFFELGFDSLLMTNLATSLKELFEDKLAIPFNIGFDYPTIEKLSRFLVNATCEISKSEEKQAQTKTDTASHDIAIVGLAMNFPKAQSLEGFTQLLANKQHGFIEIPKNRWDINETYHPEIGMPSKHYVKELAFINNVDCFDANFFNISPRQSKYMDPLQRLFLQSTYHALEDANITPSSIKGSQTGVYFATSSDEYAKTFYKHYYAGEVEHSPYVSTGLAANMMSGIVGYTFDLNGPCETVDTACSSSLIAMHHAIAALRSKEVDSAIVGAGTIFLTPDSTINMCSLKALSPDSRCFSFDERANGYAKGEGVGVVLLKRLADARRDKDNIHAIIKGSGISSDGKSAGLTVPNGSAQKKAMQLALNDSGLTCRDVQYIEAHGTGTQLGDPIEIQAIQDVYGKGRDITRTPLIIGSVKSNIGNLEATSGMAGLFKAIACLQHQTIYPQANFKRLNNKITLRNAEIASSAKSWVTDDSQKRRVGINSFGYSGTNAHLIVEEAQTHNHPEKQSRQNEPHALLLSAKSESALDALLQQYCHFLRTTDAAFADICFTAQTCRDHYPYRLAILATSANEACEKLLNSHVKKAHITIYEQSDAPISSQHELLEAYLQGKRINFHKFYAKKSGYHKVKLPSYRFDLNKYWLDIKQKKKQSHAQKETTIQSEVVTTSKEKQLDSLVIQTVSAILPESNSLSINIDCQLSDLGLDSISLSELESSLIKQLNLPSLKLADNNIITVKDVIDCCKKSETTTKSVHLPPQHQDSQQLNSHQKIKQLVAECINEVFHFPKNKSIADGLNLYTLGLDSVMATEIRAKINEKLNDPTLILQIDYFINKPSVEKITQHIIHAMSKQQDTKLSNKITENEYQLTYGQLVWWISYYEGYVSNINSRLHFVGSLNIQMLELAINDLIAKNPLLRITVNYNYPSQIVNEAKFLRLPVIDLRKKQSSLEDSLNNDWHYFLGTKNARVFNIKLYQVSDSEFILNSVFSHIIGDAQMLFAYESQLKALYEARITNATLTMSINGNAFFEHGAFITHRDNTNIQEKADFWRQYLKKDTKLKLDKQYRIIDKVFEYNGFSHFELDESTIKATVQYFNQNQHSAMFGLSSLILQALKKITNQDEILSYYMLSDRDHPKYKNQIGLFLNTLALSIKIGSSVLETTQSIEQEHLYTAAYQDCPGLFKSSTSLSAIECLYHPLVKLFSLNAIKHSWVHPSVINNLHKRLTKSLVMNFNYWLYLKTGKLSLLKRKKPQKKNFPICFNFSPTFLTDVKVKQFGNVSLKDTGMLKNVQSSYLASYINIYFSRDLNRKPYLSIKGPITEEFKQLIATQVNQLLTEIAAKLYPSRRCKGVSNK